MKKGSQPQRKYDGSGEVIIARRSVSSEASESTSGITPPTRALDASSPINGATVTTSSQSSQEDRRSTVRPRSRGDLSLSDARLSIIYCLLSIVGLGFVADFAAYVEGSSYLTGSEYDTFSLSYLVAATIYVFILASSATEAFQVRTALKRSTTRRRALSSLHSKWPRRLRNSRDVGVGAGTLLILIPTIGPRTWYPSWTLALTIFITMATMSVISRSGHGDATYLSSTLLLVGSMFVPSRNSGTIVSGFQQTSGIFLIGLGILSGTAWVMRARSSVQAIPMALALLILPTVIYSATSSRSVDAVPTTGLIASTVAPLLGLLAVLVGSGRTLGAGESDETALDSVGSTGATYERS
jgi:hypothetical protein